MSVSLNQLNVLDPNSFGGLKRLARDGNSQEALRAAAQQFEGLFMQMMLKAMREATPANGLFDNDQTRMLQSFHDQQMAMQSAQGAGMGLAEVIFRQFGGDRLGAAQQPAIGPDGQPVFEVANIPRRPAISAFRDRQPASAADDSAAAQAAVGDAASRSAASSTTNTGSPESVTPRRPIPERVSNFVDRVWSHAVDAARSIGVSPSFIVAQAALETGWGRAELRTADGKPSHNLFNIKAGRNWKGPVLELPVTEYANGRAYTEQARFRAYGSYAEAFQDYVNLLSNNRRYADVIGRTDPVEFAQGLQRGGFATDPDYADKLVRVIHSEVFRIRQGDGPV